MSRATVELDFLGMEKENPAKSQFQNFIEQRRTVRGIQSAISKINSQLLRTVISSGTGTRSSDRPRKSPENGVPIHNGVSLPSKKSFSVPSTPKGNQNPNFVPTLPVINQVFRPTSETAPLTIFYNRTVYVVDVPSHKAEKIMKLAVEGNTKTVGSADPEVAVSSSDEHHLLETLNGDLPIARRKSLQSFLEKRKERLISLSPYASRC